jgi:cell division protein FtsL
VSTATARPARARTAPARRAPARNKPGYAAPERKRERPSERHLAVVDPEARRRSRHARFWVRANVTAVVCAVLLVVGIHAFMAEGQVRLEKIQRQLSSEQQQYAQRRLQVAELQAPQSIIQRAQQRGLVVAGTPRPVLVPGDLAADADAASGASSLDTGATPPPTPQKDWEKVKEHLAAQP